MRRNGKMGRARIDFLHASGRPVEAEADMFFLQIEEAITIVVGEEQRDTGLRDRISGRGEPRITEVYVALLLVRKTLGAGFTTSVNGTAPAFPPPPTVSNMATSVPPRNWDIVFSSSWDMCLRPPFPGTEHQASKSVPKALSSGARA